MNRELVRRCFLASLVVFVICLAMSGAPQAGSKHGAIVMLSDNVGAERALIDVQSFMVAGESCITSCSGTCGSEPTCEGPPPSFCGCECRWCNGQFGCYNCVVFCC